MDVQDELARLVDKRLSVSVVRKAVDGFCERFEDVTSVLEEVDEGVEREALAKKIGKRTKDDMVNGDDSESDTGTDLEESVRLREVYPRTVEEVSALLS